MAVILPTLALLSLASVATASYADNLNYRSPSILHPGLGISVRKVAARNDRSAAWDPSKLNFTHGVASGDPYDTTVIIWTRAAPTSDNDRSNVTVSGPVPLYNHDTEVYVNASPMPVCVEYKVSSAHDMSKIVDHGTVYTSSDIDYTVKLEARNLKAFTNYCRSLVLSKFYDSKTEYSRVPIQHLQLEQHISYWSHQDHPLKT